MRYVVKNLKGQFFSHFVPVETKAVTFRGEKVGDETTMTPEWKGDVALAVRFDSEADALIQIANEEKAYPLHGGPEKFAGCTVEAVEN